MLQSYRHRCERSDHQCCEGPQYKSFDRVHRRRLPCAPVRRGPLRFHFDGGVHPPHVVCRRIGEGIGHASPRRSPGRARGVPRAQSRSSLFRCGRTDQRLLGSSSGLVRHWGTNQAARYDLARDQRSGEGTPPTCADSPTTPVALSAHMATPLGQLRKEPMRARQRVLRPRSDSSGVSDITKFTRQASLFPAAQAVAIPG